MPPELKWERFPAPVYFVGGGSYTDDGEDDGESSIGGSADTDTVSDKGEIASDNESSEEEMLIETTKNRYGNRVLSKNRRLNFMNHRVKQYAVINEGGESELFFSKHGQVP
jgi:hypothetical protein